VQLRLPSLLALHLFCSFRNKKRSEINASGRHAAVDEREMLGLIVKCQGTALSVGVDNHFITVLPIGACERPFDPESSIFLLVCSLPAGASPALTKVETQLQMCGGKTLKLYTNHQAGEVGSGHRSGGYVACGYLSACYSAFFQLHALRAELKKKTIDAHDMAKSLLKLGESAAKPSERLFAIILEILDMTSTVQGKYTKPEELPSFLKFPVWK
jgi:hypothetical protein